MQLSRPPALCMPAGAIVRLRSRGPWIAFKKKNVAEEVEAQQIMVPHQSFLELRLPQSVLAAGESLSTQPLSLGALPATTSAASPHLVYIVNIEPIAEVILMSRFSIYG